MGNTKTHTIPKKGVLTMLVLTRNVGEKLIIDGNIEVMVVEAGGGSVRLGIEAPKDVHIVREELLEEDDS